MSVNQSEEKRVTFEEKDEYFSDDDSMEESSDDESSENEEEAEKKRRNLAVWERPTEVYEVLECGGYMVQYKTYMLEPPPDYYERLREEFRMFSLRSRVIKYREEVLGRLIERLEDKLNAREEELEGLDTQKVLAGDPAKKLYVVQTNIFHEPYEMTYVPGKVWREEEWLERHEHSQSFPQALEVEKARVLLLERVIAYRKEVTAARRESNSIGKFAGDTAATHIQKIFRGYMGKFRAAEKRRTYLIDRQIRAVGKIQRVWRGYISRVKTWARFEDLTRKKKWNMAIEIQRMWRGWMARQLFKRLESEFRRRREHNSAVKIQAWIRGTRGRKIAEIKKKVAIVEDVEEDYLDSTVQIQRFVRGWLGRKKVVARKVEVKLNKRVKKLAYDYISKGSFWEFLGAVNNDYQRYNDQRQREEELAATFIQQVMQRREEEQKAAWNSWKTQKKRSKKGKGSGERMSRRAMKKYLGSTDEKFFNDTMQWAKGKQKKLSFRSQRPRLSTEGGSKVQLEPLLSTTMTWQNSVLGQREPHASSVQPQHSVERMGGSEVLSPNNVSSMSQRSVPGPGFVTPEASEIVIGGVSVPAGFNVGGVSTASPYNIGSVHKSVGFGDGPGDPNSPLSNQNGMNVDAYSSLTTALEQESSVFEGASKSDFERFPADVLTRDITNADDDIDRLVLHAALRTYIPPTSRAMSGMDAFEEFLRMPPGLMKVKREAEASRYCAPYIKILKYNGFKSVRMLKRCSATQMTALGIPVALAQMLGRLMRQLYRSWQNVDPHFVAQRAISPATGENMFLQAPEPSQTFEIPENLNTLKESVLSDNYGFVMDGSQELPGGQGGAVIKLGDARELQDLWPYGDDANNLKSSQDPTSGFESAARLATTPPSRDSMSRQLRPDTAQTIDYGGESRPSTAFSSVSRPGTRGSFGSRGSMLRPSTGDLSKTRESTPNPLGGSTRPNTRGILRVSSANSRPKTGDSILKTPSSAVPSEKERARIQSRPGTTGNTKYVPGSPVRPSIDIVSPENRTRPATVGNVREKKQQMLQRHASLQLPLQHRPPFPGGSRPGTASDMVYRPGTGQSFGSRPSTRATVDYGFEVNADPGDTLDYDAAIEHADETLPTPRHREGEGVGDGNDDEAAHQQYVEQERPSTAERLRDKLSAPLTIDTLETPIENLIVNAALHVYKPPDCEFETGAESFDYFIGELVSFPPGPDGEKRRREVVRKRTKNAFRWAQKFVNTFKSYNLWSIKDLVSLGRPLEAFGLPEELAEKIQNALQKHLPHATVARGFDKRFQRSALDALGRPPPPLPIKKGEEDDLRDMLLDADNYYNSRTLTMGKSKSYDERIENAGFMVPPESRKWPGAKLQPFPIQSLESDFGASLPPAQPTPPPMSSIAERHKYKCRYQGCNQMFSRRYTLQLHERTHLHAQDYYFWKNAPKIGNVGPSPRKPVRAGMNVGGANSSLDGAFGQNGTFRMSDKTGFGVQRNADGRLGVTYKRKEKRRTRRKK